MSETDQIGFYVIEPYFYDDLNWDYSIIMKCLEYIRLNINDNLFHHKDSTFYLIKYGDFLGGSYPAVGARNTNVEESKDLMDFIDVFDKVEIWIKSIGLDELVKRSNNLTVISWDELNQLGHYPK